MHAHSRPVSPAPGASSEDYEVLPVLAKQTFKYVDAEALRNIPGLERLDPARLQRQTRRQVLLDGQTMNVLSDVAALTFLKHSKDGRSWSMNRRHVNVLTAPSLVYMRGGQEGSVIALVDDRDLASLIAGHKNMRKQLHSAAPALLSTSSTEIDNGQGALVSTSDTETDNGQGALVSTSDTEMLGSAALVSTSDTEMHEGQNALPLPVVATASPYALVEGQHLAPAVHEAPSSSLVLPPGCFTVTCKNASMYGKKMRDVHIAGFSVQSDAVIRFRSSDGKVVVGDLLVGVGTYGKLGHAQEALYKLIEKSDDKISDLDSLELDKEIDQKGKSIVLMFSPDVLKFFNRLGVRQVNDVTAQGCFTVTCKNASMYGKKMRDVHIAGFSMESDKVIRFRSSDGKVAVGDLLVVMGKYVSVSKAQELILKWIDIKHDILNDLESLEVDKELMEKKSISIVLMFFEDVLKFFNRLGVRQVNDVTAQVTAEVTADMDPEGMGAHMGAGVPVVEAVPFDQSILLDAINSNGSNILTTFKIENQKTIKYVDTKVQSEGDARKKDIKEVKTAMQKQNEDIHKQNEDLRKRLALLEQGAARNKRARNAPNDAPTQANNITWNKARNSFGWMKMVKGVSNGNKGFSSAEEAALDMQRFYIVAVQGSVPVRGSLV